MVRPVKQLTLKLQTLILLWAIINPCKSEIQNKWCDQTSKPHGCPKNHYGDQYDLKIYYTFYSIYFCGNG